MFVRCTVYEIWFNSLCRFCVNRTFSYVVWESNQKLDEQSVCSRLVCSYCLSQYKRLYLVPLPPYFQAMNLERPQLSRDTSWHVVFSTINGSWVDLNFLKVWKKNRFWHGWWWDWRENEKGLFFLSFPADV